MEEIDWATRDLWRDEYMAVVNEGIRVYSVAKRLFDDARFVVQQVGEGSSKHRRCAAQRALRFVTVVKRSGWDVKEVGVLRIEALVAMAKLAAAFIDVACQSLGIDKKKDISFFERVVSLLQVPGKANTYSFPFDRIRRSRDTFVIDEDGIILEVQNANGVSFSSTNVRLFENDSQPTSGIMKALPLCGWSKDFGPPTDGSEWSDPRECCLCHLCGDDSEGVFSHDDDGCSVTTSLGRLLPMHDGYWVHASCALWSSEVWESADDSFIHAVEKARGRGAQLKCFGCGHYGATVGCNKPHCPCNYHFPCAIACHAVFTVDQQVFCQNHVSSAIGDLTNVDGSEYMKALMVAPERKVEKDLLENPESDVCIRVGSLVVHSLGTIESEVDGFHSENYIFPPGYFATRIFWSTKAPRTRVVYILKVEKNLNMQPEFSILSGDDPTLKIVGHTVSQVYATFMERVRRVNKEVFSQGDICSKLPVVRKTRKKTFGLNGPQVCTYVQWLGSFVFLLLT